MNYEALVSEAEERWRMVPEPAETLQFAEDGRVFLTHLASHEGVEAA